MSHHMTDLHSETGNHQDQVKVLIEKTASSLDAALKLLFVSVQQNNIDLSVRYATYLYVMFSFFVRFDSDLFRLTDKIGVYDTVCSCHRNPSDCLRLNLIQELLIRTTLSWFGHTYVSECFIR
jgi:hypothetical protein